MYQLRSNVGVALKTTPTQHFNNTSFEKVSIFFHDFSLYLFKYAVKIYILRFVEPKQ